MTTNELDHNYPVFPLNTVLFPGTTIPLRIFEQRYLRMVSETSKADSPFVISLLCSNSERKGPEFGQQSECHEFACLARISDFSQGENGVLDIAVRAGARVKIHNAFHEDDGLMKAKLESVSETEVVDIDEQFSGLVSCFDTLKQQDPYMLKEDASQLSATELSFKLAHLVPVSLNKQQKLLEMVSTQQRLVALQNIVKGLSQTMLA